MKEWFSIAELAEAALPGLPKSKSGFRRVLSTKWRHQSGLTRKIKGVFRSIIEIHISLLPEDARAALLIQQGGVQITEQGADKEELWARYERLSKMHKKSRCEERLKVLCYMDDLVHAGMGVHDAASSTAATFGVSRMSVFNWRERVEGYERCDWLAALVPAYGEKSCAQFAPCHGGAWEVLCSDYLRPSKPAFSACYLSSDGDDCSRKGLEACPFRAGFTAPF